MSERRSVHKESTHSDRMASNVFSLKDMESQHSGLNGEFLLYQVILKHLLSKELKDSSTERKLCDYFNPEDKKDRDIMIEFDNSYKKSKAIHWYTRESCIYRLLNKALRTQNISDLIAFSQFIHDLYDQLSEEQILLLVTHESTKFEVYRGQLISKDEINRIKYGKGQFISTNSFLSTSTNRNKALEFALSNSPSSDNLTRVLLEITVDIEHLQQPYADIKRLSAFAEEEEILFMFGCIFRIDDIWEDKKLKLWRTKLTLCDSKDSDLKKFYETLEKEIKGKDMLVCIGGYMMQMQKFDEAQSHYEMLLNSKLIKDPFDLANCHYGLAQVNEKKGEYDDGINNLNLALKYLLENPKTKQHYLISQCYNHLGLIYSHQQNQTSAFHFYELALKITTNNHCLTYSGLAKLHFNMENYQIALEYQYKCLKIQENTRSSFIPNTFVEIAKIYIAMNQFNKSLELFEKAIEYQINFLSSEHPDLGYTYIQMALMFSHFNQQDKAFDLLKKTFKLQLNSLPNNHLDFGQTFKTFAILYKKENKYSKSLHYSFKLLQNQLNSLPSKHPDIADTYLFIANIYLDKLNYDQSLIYFEKLLENQIQRLKLGHIALTQTYQSIANIYLKKNDFNQSLIYFHKLLDNELETKILEDSSLSQIYENIANIYFKINSLSQALIYFNRLIDTQLINKSFDQTLIKNTYQLIGNVYLKNFLLNNNLLYFNNLFNDQLINKSTDNININNYFKIIDDLHFEKRHLDKVKIYFQQLLLEQLQNSKDNYHLINDTLKILANIHLQKEDFNQALKYFYQLLDNELINKSADDLSLNYIYKIIGEINFKLEDFDQSLIYFQKLLNNQLKTKSIEDLSLLIDTYKQIGIIFFNKFNFKQSIIHFNKSIDYQQLQLNNNNNQQNLYSFIGKIFLNYQPFKDNTLLLNSFKLISIFDNSHNEYRHFDQIIIYYQDIINNSKENNLINDSYKILGNIYLEKKDFKNSLIYFNKLIDNNNQLDEIYKIIGVIYYELNDLNESLIYFHKLLDNQLKIKLLEDSSLFQIYKIIGKIYFNKHKYSKALIFLNRSLDSQLQINNLINDNILNEIYSFIKIIYLKNKHFHLNQFNDDDQINNLTTRKLSIISSSTSSSLSANSFKFIEDIHFQKRHLDHSLNYFYQILENQLEILPFGHSLLSDSYKIISNIYLEKQDFYETLVYQNKYLINQLKTISLNHPSLANSYEIIGQIYFYKGNYEQSLTFLYRFIDCQLKKYSINHSSIIQIYNIIGKIYSKKYISDHFDERLHHFNQLFNKEPSTKKLLIDTYQTIKNIQFEHYYRDQSLIYFQKLLDDQQNTNTYFITANIYLEKHDLDKAYFYLNKSLENQIEINPFGDPPLADIYTTMANVSFQKGQLNQALKDYQQALSIYTKTYPLTHPRIKKVKQYISDIIISSQLKS